MTAATDWESRQGSSFPMGATLVPEENAINFALYSKHAESVGLLFFADDDLCHAGFEFKFDPLLHKSGPVWHCRVPIEKLTRMNYYAYQIDGPSPDPEFDWHAFDAEKLLLDPYAKDVFFPVGFDRAAASAPGSNIGKAPLALLDTRRCAFEWSQDRHVRHYADLIIYEMHVRGFSNNPNSGVPDSDRGSFAGVTAKIPYLKDLGVTAVELMPVFQFDPAEENYWGYMPLNFFSPHEGYVSRPEACRPETEFRQMVQAFHDAEIEVLLDVVYNHTCEGNHTGPTYSFKGIDNSTYYMVSGDPASPYSNFSGCGNTLHTSNRAVRQMIIDSLRYWTREMHVDGFRFDLASVFSRRGDGSINVEEPPIFGQIASDPELAKTRLIAEPWDAGGAFQLGRRFPGVQWMQWNSAFRQTVQQFVRGDDGMVPDLMTRLYGSSDLFPDDRFHAMRPFQSVNYVASHDGFTLYDLVSYNEKRNWANGHQNQDGPQDHSWNCGFEGDEGAPTEVLQLRKQQVKNLFCLLMLSNGTPMFRMGDEFLQTQHGNNNPYNQDNETTWLDWSRMDQFGDVFRFFRMMIALRKAHPSISRSGFWREDIRWYGTSQSPDLSHRSRSLAFCLHGRSQLDDDLYVIINGCPRQQQFGVFEGQATQWHRVIDTSKQSPDDIVELHGAAVLSEPFYDAEPRSVVVLVRNRRGTSNELNTGRGAD